MSISHNPSLSCRYRQLASNLMTRLSESHVKSRCAGLCASSAVLTDPDLDGDGDGGGPFIVSFAVFRAGRIERSESTCRSRRRRPTNSRQSPQRAPGSERWSASYRPFRCARPDLRAHYQAPHSCQGRARPGHELLPLRPEAVMASSTTSPADTKRGGANPAPSGIPVLMTPPGRGS